MPLCRFRAVEGDEPRLGLIRDDLVFDLATGGGPTTLGEALSMTVEALREAIEAVDVPGAPVADVTLLAPIDEQEVWAAGVTYLRSRDARMEESQEKTVYDRVYDAARPEIFFKAMASRVFVPVMKEWAIWNAACLTTPPTQRPKRLNPTTTRQN